MLRANGGGAAAARAAEDDDDFGHLAASWLDDDDDDDDQDDKVEDDEGEDDKLDAVEDDKVEGGSVNDDSARYDEKSERAPSPEPVDDKVQDPHTGDADVDQDAVIPWLESDASQEDDKAEQDGEDSSAASHSELAVDDWVAPVTTSAAESPVASRTTPAASLFAQTEPGEPKPPSVSEFLLLGTESRSNSLQSEIPLLDQAMEEAAAMNPSPECSRPREMTTSRSFRSALPRYHDTVVVATSTATPTPRAAAADVSEARVHPVATGASVVDKESERQKAAPLSPNSLRRANSVYVTPTSTSKTLMKRQDSLSANVSRSQMLWNSDPTRRGSRMLDEWKRKEIWHDFKRAEENVVGPHAKKALAATVAEKDDATTSGGRLESLLQHLRAEISLPFQMADKPARPSSTAAALFTTAATSASAATGGSGHRTSTFDSAVAQSTLEQQGRDSRREAAGASAPPPPASVPASPSNAQPGCSRFEYEQMLQEKRLLADELENRTRVSATDKEIIRSMSDRIQQLENSDRENKFLKEEIQRHVMQELISKEQLKTLGEQLSLTTKSEEQLKLQTQQLFQQNQSLQADLLEKIAAETSKIHKMAHLSAEKESLMQELKRKEAVSSKRRLHEKDQLQRKSVRHLLRVKRLSLLKAAVTRWRVTTERMSAATFHALSVFAKAHRLVETKAMAKAFHRLRINHIRSQHQVAASDMRKSLEESSRNNRTLAAQILVRQLAQVVDRWRTRQQNQALRMLHTHRETQHKREATLELGFAKLGVLVSGRTRCGKQSAFAKWKARAQLEGTRACSDKALRSEKELNEAKDCVFSLSREKTRLEEKLEKSRNEFKRQADQLSENTAELQVVKHGYVTTVIRDLERGWLRCLFTEWRVQTIVSLATKDLRLQSEMAELKAAERDKHAKTVDDYNRVLRNDLERFQFFSQDKRIAVDVLTKKLLREEEKFKQMEEHQVLLEERAHALRGQLSVFVEWEGLELPLSMLLLAKDIAINNLRELFLLHATVTPDPTGYSLPSSPSNGGSDSNSSRLSMDSLLRMIEYSTLLEETQTRKEELPEVVTRHFPEYAVERGVLFPDFLVGLNKVVQETFRDSPRKSEQTKAFWRSLLALIDPTRWDAAGNGSSGREHLIGGRSPWAGRLTDDILQNQEKLLAVLEHETAVVERAVMEKSSLKHTYPTSDHASVASTYFEYQCDPMLPPEPSNGTPSPLSVPAASTSSSTARAPGSASVLAVPAEMYTNWYQTAQIRDLFLAFHKPLLKVLMKYSNETRVASHNNQLCLQLPGILRMLDDLKLHPTYLSTNAIHLLFGNLSDRDGYLTPQAFTLFLGSCALELYTKSQSGVMKPPAFTLSAREILTSFFCDLGFLAESAAPPPARICFVGIEIENILWSLFEYYSTTDETGLPRAEDERVSMTSAKFVKFMAEIAGTSAGAEEVYRRVQTESTRATSRPASASPQWGMYFDDFYSAVAYIQETRNKQTAYLNPGEAVRHWMQQTQ